MEGPEVRYARTDDGVDIAFAIVGQGPPLLALRQYMSEDVHSQLAGEARGGIPWLEFAKSNTVVLFDWRGTGLSAAAPAQSLASGLSDIAAVVASASLASFDMFAPLTPAHFAMAYAAEQPERVRRMVLWNPGKVGASMRSQWADFDLPPIETTHFRDYAQLVALRIFGWERAAAARQFFETLTERYTGESWARLNESIEAIDGTSFAARVACPCLILIDHNAVSQTLVAPDRQQFMRRLAAAIPDAHLSIVKRGEASAAFDRIRSFLGRDDGTREPELRTAAGTRTVLFTDIVGHTEMMQRLGDAKGRDVLREHERITRETLKQHGGAEVKTMGDGFMASFGSVTSAMDCAIALQRAFAAHTASMPEPLHVRVGLNAGEPIEEDGDLFGATVILASRIAGKAGAGEIFVPEPVRHLLSGKAFTFSDRGEYEMKGFDDAVRLYEVRWRE